MRIAVISLASVSAPQDINRTGFLKWIDYKYEVMLFNSR